MAYERWEGSAELTGYGALVAQTYPITMWQEYDEAGERVDLEISQPMEILGQLDANQYKQIINIGVNADRARAEELAMEAVLEQADRISFATNRRVKTSLVQLQWVPPDEQQDEGRAILYARRWKGPQDLATVDVDFLAYISQQIGDPQSDRARRIVRALRWLRRASSADDEVEEFTILAMGFEALTKFLPRPPIGRTSKNKGRSKKPPAKPGTSEVLKYWAVKECGIAQKDWKLVGGLRHDLFHGGLTETADTRSKLGLGLPYLRLVLGLALKHVLGLPPHEPPYLSLPPFIFTDFQMTAPGFTPAPDPSPHEPDDDEAASPDS